MPQQTITITPQGPLITLMVGISIPRQTALKSADLPIASPVPATLLVDTGASCTVLDEEIIQLLNLQPTGSIDVHTPSTGAAAVPRNQYDILLAIGGAGAMKVIATLPIVGSDFSAQGINGLLGRDVLSHGSMFYDGIAGRSTLCLF